MSKNITIQEGGVAKQLTVDKLKTNLVDNGTCLWVPEDEVQLGTKTITENGTYKASDDGYYGYEQVIVNIAGAGTVTGTDGDGDEAVAHTDPETGELLTDKVPSSIKVITPPTNPYGIYTDGQTISPDGMVVKAYLKTGGEYGTVPNGEVTLNPTTAVYDASTDTGAGEATLDGETIPYAHGVNWSYTKPTYGVGTYVSSSNYLVAINGILYEFASGGYGDGQYMSTTTREGQDPYIASGPLVHSTTITYTYNGQTKTVYVSSAPITYYSDEMENWSGSLENIQSGDMREIAKILFEGDKEENPRGSVQTINVSWPRPLDGKVLETTFEILVAPPYSGGGEG